MVCVVLRRGCARLGSKSRSVRDAPVPAVPRRRSDPVAPLRDRARRGDHQVPRPDVRPHRARRVLAVRTVLEKVLEQHTPRWIHVPGTPTARRRRRRLGRVASCELAHCRAGGVPMWLSSRGRGGFGAAVVGAVTEHGVEDVAAAAGQADQRGIVLLALSPFAVVLSPADRVHQRREGGEKECAFELAVASPCRVRDMSGTAARQHDLRPCNLQIRVAPWSLFHLHSGFFSPGSPDSSQPCETEIGDISLT